jgi:hypothetical protein
MGEARQLLAALQQQRVVFGVENSESISHVDGLVCNIGIWSFIFYLPTELIQ